MEGQSGLSELSVISWVFAVQGCLFHYIVCKLSKKRMLGYRMFCNMCECEAGINHGVLWQVCFQLHSVSHAPWPLVPGPLQ